MAPSRHLNVTLPPIVDLRTSNDIEWKKREEIMHEILDQMRNERAHWEQKEQIRLAKEDDGNKIRKGGKIEKTKRKIKIKPGPMVVTEFTVVDVTDEYNKYENDLLLQQNASMSPDSLNLAKDEINLREFEVIGGIYTFSYLIRPEQQNELKPRFLFKIGTGHILDHVNFIATDESEMVEIHVKLNKNVNWWLVPTICYWQAWEESDEFLSLSPQLQDFHLNYEKYKKDLENLLFTEPDAKMNYNLVKCINDFYLDSLPQNIDFYQLVCEYIEPRLPITYKFQVELDAVNEVKRKEALRQKEIVMEKAETKFKRRALFDKEMNEYLAEVQQEIGKGKAKLQSELDLLLVSERERLVNLGENDLQITRYLKRKNDLYTTKMRDFEIDEMTKYHEYRDEHFKNEVFAFELEDDIVVDKVRCHVDKTSPRELYLKNQRQMPLKIINEDTVYNFNVPNEPNAPDYNGEKSDDMLLSTFFRYLLVLNKNNKPILKDKPKSAIKLDAVTKEPFSKILVLENSDKNIDIGSKIKSSKKKKKSKPSKKAAKPAKKPKSPNKPKKPKKSTKINTKKLKAPIEKENDSKQKLPEEEPIIEVLSAQTKKSHKNKLLSLIPHASGKWLRSGIKFISCDTESREIIFQISRFGTFGFAMPKYCNFPLTYWELYPNSNKKHSIMLKIIGQFAEVKIEITDTGFVIERIVPNNINFVPNRTATLDYRGLLSYLSQCCINIAPSCDASMYIDGVCEKHRSMEEHTYNCIAHFATTFYFRMSSFNRLLDRRIAVFEVYELLEKITLPEKFTVILVTPQICNSVEVSEVESKTGEKSIEYKMVPAEQEYYPDLYNLIMANCNELTKRSHSQMKLDHRFNIARLLSTIRPLSFA